MTTPVGPAAGPHAGTPAPGPQAGTPAPGPHAGTPEPGPPPGQHPGTPEPAPPPSPTAGTARAGGEARTADRLIASVIANTSLLTALVIYMGWAYLNSSLGFFRISPLDLNLSIVDYSLHSLRFFFNTDIIFLAVVLVGIVVIYPRVVAAVGARAASVWALIPSAVRSAMRRVKPKNDGLTIWAGFLITITAVSLAWLGLQKSGLHDWFAANPDLFYLVIALLGIGPLILTRPSSHRVTHFLYPLAVAVACACALWVGGLYASSLGTTEAVNFASHLSSQTAVTLYSTQPLSISGYGVTVRTLHGSFYRYRYEGLRLLVADSGTYYLLPVGWRPKGGHTYVIDGSSQIRIELSR